MIKNERSIIEITRNRTKSAQKKDLHIRFKFCLTIIHYEIIIIIIFLDPHSLNEYNVIIIIIIIIIIQITWLHIS